MKQVYQACDGKLFNSHEAATRHERDIKTKWLEDTNEGQFYAKILSLMDDQKEDGWYGTERELGMEFVNTVFAQWFFEPFDSGEDNDCCIRSEN